ncbi:SDR family NAD(P)-dependent oxidoreductase [Streptomyces sp. bgisy084]|uniref:SDR family NAD(P)-dependent oxidoreductase n=1 Tax=unclassified Streptomyces TaxID=2593676 RepID=UPI003D730139
MGQQARRGTLDGRVAIVTGSTSGIGAAIAEGFAREGARVVVTGRRIAEGEAVAGRLGPDTRFVPADLLDDGAAAELVARTAEWFGRIDILVNNAGTPGKAVSVAELDLADFDRAVAVHVRAPLLLIQQVARHMMPRRSGSVLNVASVSGQRAGFSGPDYSIAKAAMVHLTRCAAVDLGQSGIRVNTISPGPVATGIHAKAAGVAGAAADELPDVPLFARFLPQFQPDPHIGRPADIAATAVFLASDGARFVNGQNIVVDGALTAGRPWSVAEAECAAMEQAARATGG